jgi:AcrR family transcriptional regulator
MRPSGSRNSDFDSKRASILSRLQDHVTQHGPAKLSMRELAQASGVQVNTLQHYFGSRDELVAEIFAQMVGRGKPYVDALVASAEKGSAEEVLKRFLFGLIAAWQPGALASLHTAGLVEGLSSPALGPGYVSGLLEPTLQGVEALLARLMELKKLKPITEVREAALALVCPILMALLHQKGLGGNQCRPLDLQNMARLQVVGFLRGWQA